MKDDTSPLYMACQNGHLDIVPEQFFSYTMASEINWNSLAGKTIIWNQPSGHVVQIKQIGLEH